VGPGGGESQYFLKRTYLIGASGEVFSELKVEERPWPIFAPRWFLEKKGGGVLLRGAGKRQNKIGGRDVSAGDDHRTNG